MEGTRVSLSSGDVFYVDAELDEVAALLGEPLFTRMVYIGSRRVNPFQVAQLTYDRQISSIHTPERLEQEVPA